MMSFGIIHSSSSNWISALHLVPKGNDTWWACVEYRVLNSVVKPYMYPISHTMTSYQVKRFFIKMNLIRDYHQILVELRDTSKNVITNPFGFFEFLLHISFGLRKHGTVLLEVHFACIYVMPSSSFLPAKNMCNKGSLYFKFLKIWASCQFK